MSTDGQDGDTGFWNYRLMRHDEDGEVTYAIHEVFYTDAMVTGWTQNAIAAQSDERIGILEELAHMVQAYRFAVLDFKTGLEVEPELELPDSVQQAGAALHQAAKKGARDDH